MIDTESLRRQFVQKYTEEPRIFRAPGRVNLIGEHTDYNDGFVMPVAVNMEVYIAASARADRRICVGSVNFTEDFEFSLDDLDQKISKTWLKYVQGSALTLDRLHPIRGANLLIDSNLPIGAGLSSSAALEMAVAYSLAAVSDAEVEKWTLVKIGQTTEHEFAGVRGGVMDQFASMFGTDDHALFLDCRTLEWSPIPFSSKLVICNTKTKHDLAESEYNKRRAECEAAADLLGRTSLRDVSLADFESKQHGLPDALQKRARHILKENERVQQAAGSLERNDLHAFGRLMNESHESLRLDFEVSCRELDLMVEISRRQEGVIGARMTGGGFGGCSISLFEDEVPPDFTEKVAIDYQQATGIEPEFYVCKSVQGASEIIS